jgi:Glycosyltransferase 61/Nucleotide-diphospho-sugar transferase
MPLDTARLVDLSTVVMTLCGRKLVRLPKAVTHTNLRDHNPGFANHVERDIYIDRTVMLDGISLVSLPPRTTIQGESSFALRIEDVFVDEQIGPWQREFGALDEAAKLSRASHDIAEHCLLTARYGGSTWGHWLAEILPRAVLAEQAYPGRFKFVVPDWGSTSPFGMSAYSSLAAYGITADRCLPINGHDDYRFQNLFSVSAIWPSAVMHPDALHAMRHFLKASPSESPYPREGKLALRRSASNGRRIDNNNEVYAALEASGFGVVDVGKLGFLDQVAAFRGADFLFGVLGSDLSGLIYSPDGVKVVTAAPHMFGDRFFYNLIQHRNGAYADLRGPVTELNNQVNHLSAFHLDTQVLRETISDYDLLRGDSAAATSRRAPTEQAILPKPKPLLFCFSKPSLEPNLIRFLSSLRDECECHVIDMDSIGSNDQQRGDAAIWEAKTQLLCDLSDPSQNDPNRIVFFFDIDLVFYRSIFETAIHALNGHDVAFQCEGIDTTDVNTGVIVCRPSEKSFAFWQLVHRHAIAHQQSDQAAVNAVFGDVELMVRLDIRICRLPTTIYCDTQRKAVVPYGSVVLHRANPAATTDEKWVSLTFYRKFFSLTDARSDAAKAYALAHLHDHSWRFGKVGQHVDYGRILFDRDGGLSGYSNPNERRFVVVDAGILILGESGEPTTLFDEFYYDPVRRKLLIAGMWPFAESLKGIRHIHYLITDLGHEPPELALNVSSREPRVAE